MVYKIENDKENAAALAVFSSRTATRRDCGAEDRRMAMEGRVCASTYSIHPS